MGRALIVLVLLAAACGCSLIRTEGTAGPPDAPASAGTAQKTEAPALRLPALAQVRPGMSASEVESAAGSPVAKEFRGRAGNVEVWYYDGGVVILQDNQVKFRFAAPST